MVCEKCSNWKCEDITLEEYKSFWGQSIGGEVTPGISKRYKRAAENRVKISNKYE